MGHDSHFHSVTILKLSSQPSVTAHCLCVCALLGVCCHGIQRGTRGWKPPVFVPAKRVFNHVENRDNLWRRDLVHVKHTKVESLIQNRLRIQERFFKLFCSFTLLPSTFFPFFYNLGNVHIPGVLGLFREEAKRVLKDRTFHI